MKLKLPGPIIMGLIILVITVIGVGFVLFGINYGSMGEFEANLWVGILGIFATIGLALGIYIQANQNVELIENTEEQTTIIRESEWIPQVEEDLGNNRFSFYKNPPSYPEIKIDLESESTGWIKHEVMHIANKWNVELRTKKIKRTLETEEWKKTKGTLTLRFESITGAEYRFEYPISIHILETGNIALSASPEVKRKLPWNQEDENG